MKSKLEVADDFIDDFVVFDEGDDISTLGMTGGAESSSLTTVTQEPFLSTVWTSDTGKTAHLVAAVLMLLR